jgi:hypothetical protein
MPARLHALMQYAHNLNHIRCDRAVIEHMNRAPHPPLGSALLACRRWKLRMPGRSSSRCRVAGPSGSVATLRITAAMSAAYRRSPADPHWPPAGHENGRKIRLRQPREAKARHPLPRSLARSSG